MAPTSPAQSRGEDDIFPEYKEAPKLRGRRFLLLMSFAAGVVTLFLTSMMFRISNEHLRLRMISFFIIVFTAFYSPVSVFSTSVLIFCGTRELRKKIMGRALVLFRSYIV